VLLSFVELAFKQGPFKANCAVSLYPFSPISSNHGRFVALERYLFGGLKALRVIKRSKTAKLIAVFHDPNTFGFIPLTDVPLLAAGIIEVPLGVTVHGEFQIAVIREQEKVMNFFGTLFQPPPHSTS